MARRAATISGPAERAGRTQPPLRIALSEPNAMVLARRTLRSPSRVPGRFLTAGLLALACWWSVLGQADAAEKAQGHLSVRDALTAPGKPARIEAKLVRRGLGQPGLGGEPLELLVGGNKPVLAMTGGDGQAFFDATCRMRGTYVVTVRVAGSPRVDSPDATGTLACWERRRPILLVDLAALAEESKTPFAMPPGLSLPVGSAAPEPITEAAAELKRLTDYFYNVIYLSWSQPAVWPRESDARTWLQQAQFPTGLLATATPGQAGLSALLDRLKAEGWDNVKVGIGRTREFAETLVAHRIDTVILPAGSRDEEVPKKAQIMKNWMEIRKKLRS
ncbi:MAG: hypothetical protein FJ245_09400 [Nitrospira sp.]|nr:hypothetical protein [Nitrospira sp.]